MGGLFFFSSRKRHTILTFDWSSDVCSSDLTSNRSKRNDAHESIKWKSDVGGIRCTLRLLLGPIPGNVYREHQLHRPDKRLRRLQEQLRDRKSVVLGKSVNQGVIMVMVLV